jgi:hypothetical protein
VDVGWVMNDYSLDGMLVNGGESGPFAWTWLPNPRINPKLILARLNTYFGGKEIVGIKRISLYHQKIIAKFGKRKWNKKKIPHYRKSVWVTKMSDEEECRHTGLPQIHSIYRPYHKYKFDKRKNYGCWSIKSIEDMWFPVMQHLEHLLREHTGMNMSVVRDLTPVVRSYLMVFGEFGLIDNYTSWYILTEKFMNHKFDGPLSDQENMSIYCSPEDRWTRADLDEFTRISLTESVTELCHWSIDDHGPVCEYHAIFRLFPSSNRTAYIVYSAVQQERYDASDDPFTETNSQIILFSSMEDAAKHITQDCCPWKLRRPNDERNSSCYGHCELVDSKGVSRCDKWKPPKILQRISDIMIHKTQPKRGVEEDATTDVGHRKFKNYTMRIK